MNEIVDVSLSASAYTLPAGKNLSSFELLLVVAFLAVLMLLVGLMIVYTCLHKMIFRAAFGGLFVLSLLSGWIVSGLVVSMLVFYIKPTS